MVPGVKDRCRHSSSAVILYTRKVFLWTRRNLVPVFGFLWHLSIAFDTEQWVIFHRTKLCEWLKGKKQEKIYFVLLFYLIVMEGQRDSLGFVWLTTGTCFCCVYTVPNSFWLWYMTSVLRQFWNNTLNHIFLDLLSPQEWIVLKWKVDKCFLLLKTKVLFYLLKFLEVLSFITF